MMTTRGAVVAHRSRFLRSSCVWVPFLVPCPFASLAGSALAAQTAVPATDHLRSETVLLIRHAEKPLMGNGLTPAGEMRAKAYVAYFEPFHEGAERFAVDALFAGADSANSNRPRLTLLPLSERLHLPVDASVSTKDPDALVALLRGSTHGAHPLVCWRHGQMPALLHALGADPAALLPDGKWPDDVYDWVIVLRFDAQGKLAHADRVVEHIDLTK